MVGSKRLQMACECHITDVSDNSPTALQASAEHHELLKAQLGLAASFLCRVMEPRCLLVIEPSPAHHQKLSISQVPPSSPSKGVSHMGSQTGLLSHLSTPASVPKAT